MPGRLRRVAPSWPGIREWVKANGDEPKAWGDPAPAIMSISRLSEIGEAADELPTGQRLRALSTGVAGRLRSLESVREIVWGGSPCEI